METMKLNVLLTYFNRVMVQKPSANKFFFFFSSFLIFYSQEENWSESVKITARAVFMPDSNFIPVEKSVTIYSLYRKKSAGIKTIEIVSTEETLGFENVLKDLIVKANIRMLTWI